MMPTPRFLPFDAVFSGKPSMSRILLPRLKALGLAGDATPFLHSIYFRHIPALWPKNEESELFASPEELPEGELFDPAPPEELTPYAPDPQTGELVLATEPNRQRIAEIFRNPGARILFADDPCAGACARFRSFLRARCPGASAMAAKLYALDAASVDAALQKLRPFETAFGALADLGEDKCAFDIAWAGAAFRASALFASFAGRARPAPEAFSKGACVALQLCIGNPGLTECKLHSLLHGNDKTLCREIGGCASRSQIIDNLEAAGFLGIDSKKRYFCAPLGRQAALAFPDALMPLPFTQAFGHALRIKERSRRRCALAALYKAARPA